MTAQRELSLQAVVGKGYADFWNFKGRYRVCKGSRASKKSKTTALWLIFNMMNNPEANALVVRKVYRTLHDSCFTELKWAVARFGVSHLWDFSVSPLKAVYRPTGQVILFRGMDDPLKLASVTVEHGFLCWVWIEEAYEIMNEEDFDLIDESIRGEIPDTLYKQLTLTFNPWNERHWIKKRFYDPVEEAIKSGREPDSEIMAKTTDYRCNEWLDPADSNFFERMKKNNPRRYQVAGLGNWGIVDGLVYENWKEELFTLEQIRKEHGDLESAFGLDFGYTQDPSAVFVGFITKEARRIYVWDEMYKKGMSNRAIFEEVTKMGYGKERIVADSAEPKSIDELRDYGLRVKRAQKGRDSVNNGIQFIQDYEIIVNPRCVNFLTEISNYTFAKDRFGTIQNEPIDDFNHLMDAMRYALEENIAGRKARLNTNISGGF